MKKTYVRIIFIVLLLVCEKFTVCKKAPPTTTTMQGLKTKNLEKKLAAFNELATHGKLSKYE